MDKIAAYDLVLADHPLWEKEAQYVVVPPAYEMMSDGQLEAEHRRLENLKADPFQRGANALAGAALLAPVTAAAAGLGGSLGGRAAQNLARDARIGAAVGSLAGGALGAKYMPMTGVLAGYQQGKVRREQKYRKSLKEPSQEYRIMPVEKTASDPADIAALALVAASLGGSLGAAGGGAAGALTAEPGQRLRSAGIGALGGGLAGGALAIPVGAAMRGRGMTMVLPPVGAVSGGLLARRLAASQEEV